MSNASNKRTAAIEQRLRTVLRSGRIPTLAEVNTIIGDPALIERTGKPTDPPGAAMNGQIMSSAEWNELADGLEEDIGAIYATLDDSWAKLAGALRSALDTLPSTQRYASLLAGQATRSLALTPLADGVAVSTRALAISGGVTFADLTGADMALSSGIEIDMAAGAVVLQRGEVEVLAASAYDEHTITGEYPMVTLDRQIGDPSWTLTGDATRTYCVVASAPDADGAVSLTLRYKLAETAATAVPLGRLEVALPDGAPYTVDVMVKATPTSEYVPYGSASGRVVVIVDGGTTHITEARITITKYGPDDTHFHGSALRHDYLFHVGQVRFLTGAAVAEGNVVTDTISLAGATLTSLVVDAEATIPDTSQLNFYVARDDGTGTALSDFNWIAVRDLGDPTAVALASSEPLMVAADHPTKLIDGAGAFSNSVYAICPIDGNLLAVTEGLEQFEVRGYDVEWKAAQLSFSGWASRTPYTVTTCRNGSVSGHNYYHLSTTIFTAAQSSAPLALSTTAADYRVAVNGVNVTERVKAGASNVALLAGANKLEIVLKTTNADPVAISIADMPGKTVAIARPDIVTDTAIGGPGFRAANQEGTLIVNHDPTGRIFLVTTERPAGNAVTAVRLRAQLLRGVNGSSPQLKTVYVTTGV